MRRRLFDLLTLLSLLLCVAVIVLWVRGAWVYDKASVSYYRLVGDEVHIRTFDANSRPGWVQWTIVRCDVPAREAREARENRGLRWAAGSEDVARLQRTPAWVRYGFGAWGESKTTDLSKLRGYDGPPRSPYTNHYWYIATPHWLLALLAAALPARWIWRRVRSRRRVGAGRCPACGYDLRATPGKCPECGTAAMTPT